MIFFLLLAVFFLPDLFSYFGISSSTAAGMMLAAGLSIFLCHIRPLSHRITLDGGISFGVFAALMIIGIAFHFAIASIYGQIDLVRGFTSMAPLGMLIWGSAALARLLTKAGPTRVDKAVRSMFWILFVVALLAIANPFPELSRSEKSVFPFSEPSFFALAFTPILLFMCVTSRRARMLLWTSSLAIALVHESLTLLVGCTLVAFICLRWRVLIPMLLTLSLVLPYIEKEYYTERIKLSEENLSSLVYIQGWQLVIDAWKRTSGWGVGFQQLGHEVPDTLPIRDLVQAVAEKDMNLLDGGFVAAKLLAEFGLVGALCISLYFWVAFRAILLLRRAAVRTRDLHNPLVLVAASFITSFLIDLMVRGTGYFTATALLTSASLYVFLGQVSCKNDTPKAVITLCSNNQ